MIRQITYISTARRDIAAADIATILAVSRRNNALLGVTGVLLYDGHRFLQGLEGDAVTLDATLRVIRADPRHRAVVVLKDRTIEAREFGEWAMAEQMVDPDGADAARLADRVDRLVGGVRDPNVRAQFSQFARRQRSAA